jgi:hypothetical protein
MHRVRLVPLFAAVVLVACQTPAPQPLQLPQLTFGHLPAYNLDIASIEVENRYQAPLASPNIDHLMPVTPAAAAERWARDRLRAVGSTGRAVFVIKDGRVTETVLPKTPGLTGFFTKEQTGRYDAVIDVEIEIRGERGYRDAVVSGRAQRSQTVREDASPNDRQRVMYELTEKLMADLNATLEASIRQNLPKYLR